MRWQPQRETASKLSGRYEKLTIGLAGIGGAIVVVGWCNLVAFIGWGKQRLSFIELADEQLALLNVFQPICLIFLSVFCLTCARFEFKGERQRSFLWLSIGFVVLAAGELQSLGQFATYVLPPSEAGWLAQATIDSHGIYIRRFRSLSGTDDPVAVVGSLLLVPVAAGCGLNGFLRRLPVRHSIGFLLCGAIYVTGVLGLEAVSQVLAIESGPQSVPYLVASGFEESLETLGLVGFALVLSRYMRESHPKIRFLGPWWRQSPSKKYR